MRKLSLFFCILLLVNLLTGCGSTPDVQIAATTLPVYDFTRAICQNTDLQVVRLIDQEVSCLHDYTLQISQMRALEGAELVVISGAGLEDFLEISSGKNVLDASVGVPLLETHCQHKEHHHEADAHIWLSPQNAMLMAKNICIGLSQQYPQYASVFAENLENLLLGLQSLDTYAKNTLSQLRSRELITFHDGFSYLAESYDLTILKAIEEESGSEASAAELIELITLTEEHDLSAIFTEKNGSISAADIIRRETGASIYTLDMAMAGNSYFEAMYHNIDTLKEALG